MILSSNAGVNSGPISISAVGR